jgi:PAS domain S-box-containing protein
MTPLRLSYIWYQRLYVALFVVSLSYVTLYVLSAFDIQYIPENVFVDFPAAIASLITAILSTVFFFMKKRLTTFTPAFIAFGLFTLTTAYLVQSTGGAESSFLAIWALIAFISPIFGAYGWLPVLVITSSYVAGAYLSEGLATDTIILTVISSIAPLIAGLVMWRDMPESEDTSQRNVKHLANQLSEVAQKSEIVINAIGDGVIAIDGKGTIELINPAAQEMLGWGKQDALMLQYGSILKLTDENNKELNPAVDPIQQVLNTNQQARSNKLIAVSNSGKKLAISLVASPIGEVGSGVIAVFRDITNERAEEREQAEFISTASHEMRTPVAAIEGYLGLALNPNTATVDAKARDFILKAHEAAQHLGRLFQDLLDVTKSEDGRMTSTPKVVDLVPFTQTIVQGLTQKAADKGLNLVFTPGETGGTGQGIRKLMPVYFVNLDNDHIREVLDNLIENAIKYTPEGDVQVDINGTENKVIISIKDTGLGIPTEDIPHLFQKFYRVDNMDRQSIGGTGLGLYLCRRLVEAMQGRLWVESTFGSGSTFFVELPRIDSQEANHLRQEQEQQAAMAVEAQPIAAAEPSLPQFETAPGKSIPVTFADVSVPTTAPPTPQPQAQPVSVPVAVSQPIAQPVPQPVTPPAPVVSTQAPLAPVPVAPAQAPIMPQQQPMPALQPAAKPATTVPRGETLTREQINERVRQLEALAQQQRGAVTPQARQ